MNKWKEALKNVLWLFVFLVVLPFVFMGQDSGSFPIGSCAPVPTGLSQCGRPPLSENSDCENYQVTEIYTSCYCEEVRSDGTIDKQFIELFTKYRCPDGGYRNYSAFNIWQKTCVVGGTRCPDRCSKCDVTKDPPETDVSPVLF